MKHYSFFIVLICLFFILTCVNCLFPGLGPSYYCLNSENDCTKNLDVYSNSLYSLYNLERKEYTTSLFCQSKDKNENSHYQKQDFGQNLFGDKIIKTAYSMQFGKINPDYTEACALEWKEQNAENTNLTINQLVYSYLKDNYRHEWIADNIPILFCGLDKTNSTQDLIKANKCSTHIPIGCILQSEKNTCSYSPSEFPNDGKVTFLNHFEFIITYAKTKESSPRAMIIYVQVVPSSILDSNSPGSEKLIFETRNGQLVNLPDSIKYYFKSNFTENNQLTSQNRIDYLVFSNNSDIQIKWWSIFFSICIFVLLSIIIGMTFSRLIRRDISRYTKLLDDESLDVQDEYGWKLLQGDVLRPPRFPMLLAITVGTGLQLTLMTLITLLFAAIGFFTPSHRGAIITCVVVLYVLFGSFCGYVSSRLYKFFGGINWKTCVIMGALLHPGIIFMNVAIINIVLHASKSPSAIPHLTVAGIFLLWILISTPLNFIGSFLGFRMQTIHYPTKVNRIPRFIPPQKFYNNRFLNIFFGGLLPFISLFTQFYFIVTSIWMHYSYFMFGFLFSISLLTCLICAEISLILAYFHLYSEDYRWQWRSFFTSATTALYCFIYIIHFYTKSKITGVLSGFLYFSYSTLILYMLLLACGSIGFIATFFTILKMYSSIKSD